MYQEYFKKRSLDVSINSVAQIILNNENTHSSLSIIIEDNEAPSLVSFSEEQIYPMSNEVDVESVQEESADLDENTLITPYNSLMFEEAESSSTATYILNIHEFDKEYFKKRSLDVSINSVAQIILNNENIHSSLSIIIEDNEAPSLVSFSKEQIYPMSNEVDVESVQEDSADLDENTLITPYNSLMFEEAESSSTATDLLNIHEFDKVQPLTHIWTKAHPLE
nr:hypothetical protein [Tanacetum cinerariifolium]